MSMSGYQMKIEKKQDNGSCGEMPQIQPHTLGVAGGGQLGEDGGCEGEGSKMATSAGVMAMGRKEEGGVKLNSLTLSRPVTSLAIK